MKHPTTFVVRLNGGSVPLGGYDMGILRRPHVTGGARRGSRRGGSDSLIAVGVLAAVIALIVGVAKFVNSRPDMFGGGVEDGLALQAVAVKLQSHGGRAAAPVLCGPGATGLKVMDARVVRWESGASGIAAVKAAPSGLPGTPLPASCDGEVSFDLRQHQVGRVRTIWARAVTITKVATPGVSLARPFDVPETPPEKPGSTDAPGAGTSASPSPETSAAGPSQPTPEEQTEEEAAQNP